MINTIQVQYFECKPKDDTSNNRDNWNRFKITQRKHLRNIQRKHETK
jgi:hypothetical protein